jgi:hypothetical protein
MRQETWVGRSQALPFLPPQIREKLIQGEAWASGEGDDAKQHVSLVIHRRHYIQRSQRRDLNEVHARALPVPARPVEKAGPASSVRGRARRCPCICGWHPVHPSTPFQAPGWKELRCLRNARLALWRAGAAKPHTPACLRAPRDGREAGSRGWPELFPHAAFLVSSRDQTVLPPMTPTSSPCSPTLTMSARRLYRAGVVALLLVAPSAAEPGDCGATTLTPENYAEIQDCTRIVGNLVVRSPLPPCARDGSAAFHPHMRPTYADP